MTRHSTLTNPNDLHYAKIRCFSGSPDLITPDFIDQLLTAIDTNKIYQATGAQAGNLVELLPNNGGNGGGNGVDRVKFNVGIAIAPDAIDQLLIDTYSNRIYRATGLGEGDWLELVGGDNGLPSAIGISAGDPQEAPQKIGQQYFDFANRVQWVAVRSGSVNGWIETKDRTNLGIGFANSSSQFIPNTVHVFYADVSTPSEIESADYTFTNYIGSISGWYALGNLNNLVFSQGRGAFIFAAAVGEIDPDLITFNLDSSYTGSNGASRFGIRTSPYNIFASNDNEFLNTRIGRQYLWIPSYSHNSGSNQISVSDVRLALTVQNA
ncbi:hypothetical protein [Pseudanabaena sp. 'Roaring Creek']|uniref:hypothetical protein n=1 Tax=Pseudanabaena sp. 'Roaring Creek' TaxID=1681830 RepID=UPI0006D7B28A|nr:hypothetical protein [Pseudanabaena sp. 'Roaring Creek']